MKFVALLALSLALTHAIDVPEALQPQTLLQGTGGSQQVCGACPAGQTQSRPCGNGQPTQCKCAAGRAGSDGAFDLGTGSCQLCGASEYTDSPGQKSCTGCPENTLYASGTRTHCICSPGYIGGGTASDPCNKCGEGLFQKRAGQDSCKECESCPSGTAFVEGGCKDGHSNNLCQCDEGTAGTAGAFEVGTGACNACEANTYQDTRGQANCKSCPPNSSRGPNQDPTKCFCDAGFAGSGKGSSGCAECPNGQFQSSPGQSTCNTCSTCPANDGQVLATDCGKDVDTSCKCAVGYYGTGGAFVFGQGACQHCEPEETGYQDEEGQSSCKTCGTCNAHQGEVQVSGCSHTTNARCKCGAGHYGSTDDYEAGSGSCTACPDNQYNDEEKASSCKTCATCDSSKGYQELDSCSKFSNTLCECAAGYSGSSEFVATQDNACTACAANSYQDESGSSSCKQCPNNASSSAGATECDCDAGYTGDGKSSCSACSAGKFKSSSGSGDCEPCPDGSTSSAGASECVAEEGYEKGNDGTFSECAANTYKSAVGNSACTPCGDNSSSGTGSTSINDCICNDGYQGSAGSCTEIKPAFLTGTITQFSLTAKTITYSDISDPVVFVSPLSYNGGDSAVTRVVAGNNQYSVEIEEPDCLDQRHPVQEDCHWMVIEKGDTAYDGSTISVFTAEADIQRDVTITFPSGGAFGSAAPTCFTYIQSKNNDYYLSPRIKSTTASNLVVRVETDERHKRRGTSYNKEDLGFVCFAGGVSQLSGDWGNFIIKTATTTRGSMNREYTVNLGNSYTKAFAQMMSVRGGDPTILRHKSFSNGVLKFRLQEDRCKDRENFHVAETVAVLGFQ